MILIKTPIFLKMQWKLNKDLKFAFAGRKKDERPSWLFVLLHASYLWNILVAS